MPVCVCNCDQLNMHVCMYKKMCIIYVDAECVICVCECERVQQVCVGEFICMRERKYIFM